MKRIKYVIAVFICVLACAFSFQGESVSAASVVASGSCGENATWSLDSDGILTIAGSGKMYDYSGPSYQPWASYQLGIQEIVISKGITRIGKSSFYNCKAISVKIADSVTEIGEYAFKNASLESLSLPSSISSIEKAAFYGVYSLKKVVIPDSVTNIGETAFDSCGSVEEIVVGSGVTKIADRAFQYCGKLKKITFKSSVMELGSDLFNRSFSEANNYNIVVYAKPNSSAWNYAKGRGNITISCIQHTFISYISDNNATCTNDGTLTATCSYCGITNTIPDTGSALGHVPAPASNENIIAATCTRAGSYDEVIRCSRCEVELKRTAKTLAATGHTAADPTNENIVAPTCTTGGTYDEVVRCSKCQAELSRTPKAMNATGHTAKAAVVENKVEPTRTAAGYCEEVVYCNVCGTELSREGKAIAKLPPMNNAVYVQKGTITKAFSNKAQSFQLSASAVGGTLSVESDNKNVKVDSNGKVTIAKNFVGVAKIKITAKDATGAYKTASKNVYVKVKPGASGFKSASRKGMKLSLKWKPVSGASGYEVQCGSIVKESNSNSCTVTGLVSTKKYSARVRAYKTVTINKKKTKLYGPWAKLGSF